jgi:non-canonical (house-cleaning) NTP pyrophosphatase
MKDPETLHLTSTNEDKLAAARHVASNLGYIRWVIGHDVPAVGATPEESRVEQPYGKEETLSAALSRTARLHPEYANVISIESGMWPCPGDTLKYNDTAIITITTVHPVTGRRQCAWVETEPRQCLRTDVDSNIPKLLRSFAVPRKDQLVDGARKLVRAIEC